MPFRTILTILGHERTQDDLAAALSAISETRAHTSILLAGIAAPPTVGDYPVGIGWIERRDEDLKALKAAREQVVERCRAADISYDVDLAFTERAFLQHALFQKALHSDVAMIGPGIAVSNDLKRTVVDAVIFDARRPLVLVPEGGEGTLTPKRVLLAWNSKTEAAQAATAALELLVQADEVHLTLIDPDTTHGRNGEEPGADAAAFLSRHGVNAVIDQLASGGRPVEVVLQQHALDIGADLMVMGAYGRSRMRERIFGGVTASILEKTRLPVLMAR
jgi:Universal stress protein UspA and related nucleotide-binding proteins